MIRVVGKRGKGSFESQLDEAAKGLEFEVIDCTSGSPDAMMREGLSPFYLGPVECYDGIKAKVFELAWQCAKVYPWCMGSDRLPDSRYFAWRDGQWAREKDLEDTMSMRYPVGKTNVGKCQYAWWKVDGEFRKLGYVAARKHIYMPLYAKTVVKTAAYKRLVEMRDSGKNIMLVDFDGYNIHHPRYNFTYNDAVHCPILKMGHGFVLAMLLEGLIRVEDGEVKFADGLMDDPKRYYSPDLRKLTEEEKLLRYIKRIGVTMDEYNRLAQWQRTLLYSVDKAKLEKLGYKKAAWKRLPAEERLRILGGRS